ncbi:ATP-binding protein [Paenarthrobacter nitroguajacolicus]|uniref:ATP-binding protein n=1 Tax=Paenarthrobacter nitroguajacolicus TaxID=211146 RepID=UPI0015BBD028|nr:ATP-binding protein [Paenarthrobacter nitroguajacolicus]NWL32028.1 ATP-binding protein [Paenarthrobacter nitroguajacolicus]
MILNAPNPFRPGAGRVPPELTGRSNVLADYTALLGSVATSGEGERPWIISGLRGVGKTVLLNQCGRDAIDAGWIVIKLEASSSQPLAVQLAKEIYVALRKAATASEKVRKAFKGTFAVFRSFQIKIDPNGAYGFGFDVQPAAGKADSGQLSTDLAEMLESLGLAARAAGFGVLLAIDELQEAPIADLEAMNVALHQLGQDLRPVPLMFLGTGLPSLPAVLAKASSYAERMYLYRTLDVLSPEDTKEALVAPSQRERVTWSSGALDMVLDTSGGYPYFVQACGKHIWDVAASRTIDIDDARIGIGRARDEVDAGLYKSRWERATSAQQEFMKAMAQDNDAPSLVSEIAARLGRAQTAISAPRQSLIQSGLVYTPRRGYLAFTVPGMADYINRHGH